MILLLIARRCPWFWQAFDWVLHPLSLHITFWVKFHTSHPYVSILQSYIDSPPQGLLRRRRTWKLSTWMGSIFSDRGQAPDLRHKGTYGHGHDALWEVGSYVWLIVPRTMTQDPALCSSSCVSANIWTKRSLYCINDIHIEYSLMCSTCTM